MARGRGAARPISGQERSPIPERLAAARFDLRFADHIQAKFRDAIAPHILRPWDELPDGHRDQMRWAFRRYRLDRDVPEALAAKLATIMRDLTQRPAYDPALLEHASGRDGHEIVVERRTLGTSKRSKLSPGEIGGVLAAASTPPAPKRSVRGSPEHRARARAARFAWLVRAGKLPAEEAAARLAPETSAERNALAQRLFVEHRVMLAGFERDYGHRGFDREAAMVTLMDVEAGINTTAWIAFMQMLRHGPKA